MAGPGDRRLRGISTEGEIRRRGLPRQEEIDRRTRGAAGAKLQTQGGLGLGPRGTMGYLTRKGEVYLDRAKHPGRMLDQERHPPTEGLERPSAARDRATPRAKGNPGGLCPSLRRLTEENQLYQFI
jgi:hypothetical protein